MNSYTVGLAWAMCRSPPCGFAIAAAALHVRARTVGRRCREAAYAIPVRPRSRWFDATGVRDGHRQPVSPAPRPRDTGRPVMPRSPDHPSRAAPDSAYAWVRLWTALALSAIGGVGMWSVIVALPAVQAEFGVARSAASLPYTVTMVAFGVGGILMGRLSDRHGIGAPAAVGAVVQGLGYAVASQATDIWQFALAQGLLVGVASSTSFAPIIA